MRPIAYVRNERKTVSDDNWGNVISTLELSPDLHDMNCFAGLKEFSHILIIYHFHKIPEETAFPCRHPRGNSTWPKVGIFSQRNKNRPNRIGASTVSILEVSCTHIKVKGLDAVDGTPVLDIKPSMLGFDAPASTITEPAWSEELMRNYW